MEPLKNLSLEELKNNYIKLCRWALLRENAKTDKGKREYEAGLFRIGEYDEELTLRGVTGPEMQIMYLESLDVIEEAQEATRY